MVVRLFLILLFLNAVAFVAKADANDNLPVELQSDPSLHNLQEAMSGKFDRDERDSLTELGSRLLRWRFSDNNDDGKHYASEQMQPNHGIALINEGACLNLKWDF